jgi:hypothetical protein
MIVAVSAHAGDGKDTMADRLVQAHGFTKLALADEMKRFCREVFDFTPSQLWGSSDNRNAIDDRYGDDVRWGVALFRIVTNSPFFCRALFADDRFEEARWKLVKWIHDLHDAYGPLNGTSRLSPRIVLQLLGTEFGRGIDPQVWIRRAVDDALMIHSGEVSYTSTKGRFPNETADLGPGLVVISDVRFLNEVREIRKAGGIVVRLNRPSNPKRVGVAGHQSEVALDNCSPSEFDINLLVAEGLDKFYEQIDQLVASWST